MRRARTASIAVAVVAVYAWSIHGTELSVTELARGVPNFIDFASRLLPPDPAVLPSLLAPLAETFQVALLGTTGATLLALPLGFLGAANTTPGRLVYQATRLVLNVFRGISEFVYALLFVAMVGLGPFPGILALVVHGAGGLGKFCAESIEAIDPGPVEAVTASGASRLRVLWYAVLPQLLPYYLSYTLYYWEHNTRAATVLGVVGAGGIGFALTTSLKLYRFHEVSMIIIVILLLVWLIDRVSARLRTAVI